MKSTQIWPELLYLVRHGESAGNVARDAAVEAGEPMIDIDIRDIDVPLSELDSVNRSRSAAGSARSRRSDVQTSC